MHVCIAQSGTHPFGQDRRKVLDPGKQGVRCVRISTRSQQNSRSRQFVLQKHPKLPIPGNEAVRWRFPHDATRTSVQFPKSSCFRKLLPRLYSLHLSRPVVKIEGTARKRTQQFLKRRANLSHANWSSTPTPMKVSIPTNHPLNPHASGSMRIFRSFSTSTREYVRFLDLSVALKLTRAVSRASFVSS